MIQFYNQCAAPSLEGEYKTKKRGFAAFRGLGLARDVLEGRGIEEKIQTEHASREPRFAMTNHNPRNRPGGESRSFVGGKSR